MLIDLHAHVLPGLDDGAADLAESLDMARAAAAAGTRLIAATPHVRPDFPAVRPSELAARARALSDRIAAARIDLAVVSGAEVDLVWALGASDEELRLCSYGQRGTDLLVETPVGRLPQNFELALWKLRERGFRVLLAHPERNRTVQADPERLLRVVAAGTLVQVTAMSLQSRDRRSAPRRVARYLMERGAVHVVASDAHAAAAPRGPDLQGAFAVAAGLDRARARWMAEDVPVAILAGEPVPPPPPPSRRLPRTLRALLA